MSKSSSSVTTKYRDVQFETSTTLELVNMAYDGIVDSLTQALGALESDPKSYDLFNEQVSKAQQIVFALDDGIDEEHGELSQLLSAFYSFVRQKLIQSNMEKSSESVEEVLNLVNQVREYWLQVEVNNQSTDEASPSPTIPDLRIDTTG